MVRSVRTSSVVKLAATACLAVVLICQGYGFRIMGVQSGSMTPRFHKGDAVLLRNVTVYSTRVGDIISYRSPQDQSVIVTHRVVTVDPLRGLITTKGDANATADLPIEGHALLGRVMVILPGVGMVGSLLRSWWGLVAVVYAPLAVFVVREFVRLGRYYIRPTYQLPGRVRAR